MAIRLPLRSLRKLSRPCSIQNARFSAGSTTARRFNSTKSLDEILGTPTWSVHSLLPPDAEHTDAPAISSNRLHHLLRLSALPAPATAEEEERMLKTLSSQLHFVKEIQRVNTEGVTPLLALRDETLAAEEANEISLNTMKETLEKEEVFGKHHKRIRRQETMPEESKEAEDWDVLGYAQRKAGKYFVVESEKSQ